MPAIDPTMTVVSASRHTRFAVTLTHQWLAVKRLQDCNPQFSTIPTDSTREANGCDGATPVLLERLRNRILWDFRNPRKEGDPDGTRSIVIVPAKIDHHDAGSQSPVDRVTWLSGKHKSLRLYVSTQDRMSRRSTRFGRLSHRRSARKRAVRESTELVVLGTTSGAARSCNEPGPGARSCGLFEPGQGHDADWTRK
ncbi:hypothetical protein AXG93_163s1230 [Marchantia polymorpha subsp. ruderalis]|uniref:Uncharacterized protein n=1 Tax=Marchantia polymorpha subsp. ruderalis TaxID=1480154 RepID=A0A176VDV3_MARPO|nr:hypothetical protein AXG93_163s1230 [Marchantia polymorpha subsp. ruderalis]